MDQSIKMLIRITSYPALRTSLDDWICQWPEIYFKMSPFRFIKECFVVIIDICLFLKIIYKRSLHYVHSYTLGKHSIWDSLLKVIGPKSHNSQRSISQNKILSWPSAADGWMAEMTRKEFVFFRYTASCISDQNNNMQGLSVVIYRSKQ